MSTSYESRKSNSPIIRVARREPIVRTAGRSSIDGRFGINLRNDSNLQDEEEQSSDDLFDRNVSRRFRTQKLWNNHCDSEQMPKFRKPTLRVGIDGSILAPFFTKVYVFSNHFSCRYLNIDGVDYLCSEQYYMFYKAKLFGDKKIMSAIMREKDPKMMKWMGTQVRGFNQDLWFPVSIQVMVIAQIHKFQQDPELRQQLFCTYGTELVEASPSDIRWGICMGIEDDRIKDRTKWRGLNLMGRILSTLRDRLINRPEFQYEKGICKSRFCQINQLLERERN